MRKVLIDLENELQFVCQSVRELGHPLREAHYFLDLDHYSYSIHCNF